MLLLYHPEWFHCHRGNLSQCRWSSPKEYGWILHIIPLGINDIAIAKLCAHDDVIKWKHFPRYWPFVRGIHRSPVNSPHKGQWRGALMFSLTCAWINAWVNNHEAGDLRRHRAHYDVTVMIFYGTVRSYPKTKLSTRSIRHLNDIGPAYMRFRYFSQCSMMICTFSWTKL